MSFPHKRESINLKEREATTRLYVGADLCVRPKKNKRARERELRLFVGATMCGRPKTTIGKWQLKFPLPCG